MSWDLTCLSSLVGDHAWMLLEMIIAMLRFTFLDQDSVRVSDDRECGFRVSHQHLCRGGTPGFDWRGESDQGRKKTQKRSSRKNQVMGNSRTALPWRRSSRRASAKNTLWPKFITKNIIGLKLSMVKKCGRINRVQASPCVRDRFRAPDQNGTAAGVAATSPCAN